MAQRPPDLADGGCPQRPGDSALLTPDRPFATAADAGEALTTYLHLQAVDFLRALRLHGASAGGPEAVSQAAGSVRRISAAARRISGTLHTYRPLLEPRWADRLRAELGWLAALLVREYAYADRLDRLLGALHRLARDPGQAPGPRRPSARLAADRAAGAVGTTGGAPRPRVPRDAPPRAREWTDDGGEVGHSRRTSAAVVGVTRAGALLERRLTQSRSHAHSAALRAFGSARCHALADAVALLASEVPLAPGGARRPVSQLLTPLAELSHHRLAEAVETLPLGDSAQRGTPADCLARVIAPEPQLDLAWQRVRALLRLCRYAREVVAGGDSDAGLLALDRSVERQQDAAEAAVAAAAAAEIPRIAPATAYVLGILHADQRHQVESARLAFGHLWRQGPSERPVR